MEALVTRGLGKTYRGVGKKAVHALDSLDLTVHAGEVFGFLGRNGAGKTTTIKLLCSLLKPSRGEATVFGIPARRREARRQIGYLPEQPYFYEYLTPRETIAFYGRLLGLSRQQRGEEWERLADLLELRSIADRRIKGFSKGMRQRIGFAVALVGDPPLLILDEPMSGLDPLGRRMIRELILQQRDAKKTIFFSSHVLGDVEQICDRAGLVVQGRLTQSGRIDELLTGRIRQVDVTARGLSEAQAQGLAAQADHYRVLEDLHCFSTPDAESADALVRAIHAAGGTLAECTPVRKSLEDFFIEGQTKRPGAES
jgi:ABC-2 type transport system ATP-binding protein